MSFVTVKVEADDAIGDMRRSQSAARIAIRRRLARSGLRAQMYLRRRIGVPAGRHPFWGKMSPTWNALGGRTGKTRQRITVGPVLETPTGAAVHVGSPDRHLQFHEEGGTIKGSPWLRIPTAAAQTAAGVDVNMGRSLRDSGLFAVRTRSGNLWLAASPPFRLMYLLKESVRMRGRHIFRDVARGDSRAILGDLSELGASIARGRVAE